MSGKEKNRNKRTVCRALIGKVRIYSRGTVNISPSLIVSPDGATKNACAGHEEARLIKLPDDV